jgi:two-component system chemotaxis response regulator CheB
MENPSHGVVVIGASMGGVEAVSEVVKQLPASFAAPVFVVLHLAPDSSSYLSRILGRISKLPVREAENHDIIRPGCIYTARPDHHLTVTADRIRLTRGPKENRHRPAIDPLFRSAARFYGENAIGVILTGALDDGTYGLRVIKECGGIAVVQNPEEAQAPGMPLSAIRSVEVDHIVPLAAISPLLLELLRDWRPARLRQPCEIPEAILDEESLSSDEMIRRFGPPSGFVCPDCSGPLWELSKKKPKHFRCLTGHAYSAASFLAGNCASLEGAAWTVIRALEERSGLFVSLAADTKDKGAGGLQPKFLRLARKADRQARTLRRWLEREAWR